MSLAHGPTTSPVLFVAEKPHSTVSGKTSALRSVRRFVLWTVLTAVPVGALAVQGCNHAFGPARQTEWSTTDILRQRGASPKNFDELTHGEKILDLRDPGFRPFPVTIEEETKKGMTHTTFMLSPGPPGKGPAIVVDGACYTFSNEDWLTWTAGKQRSSRYVAEIRREDAGFALRSDAPVFRGAVVVIPKSGMLDIVEAIRRQSGPVTVSVLVHVRKQGSEQHTLEIIPLTLEREVPEPPEDQ